MNSTRTTCLIAWTLLPSLAIWVGLYMIKSAAAAFALYHILYLIPAIIWGRSLWRASFIRPKPRDVALLAAAAMLFSVGAVILYELMGRLVLSDQHIVELLKEQGLRKDLLIGFALYATIVNPLFEELFWRGVVLNELERLNLPIKHFALVWSSFTYALFHYLIFRMVLFPVAAELGTVMLAVYGALMTWIYRRTGSILTTALAHGLLTDTAVVFLLIDFFRRYPQAFTTLN